VRNAKQYHHKRQQQTAAAQVAHDHDHVPGLWARSKGPGPLPARAKRNNQNRTENRKPKTENLKTKTKTKTEKPVRTPILRSPVVRTRDRYKSMKSLCAAILCSECDRYRANTAQSPCLCLFIFSFIFIFVLGSILLPPHKSSINMLVAFCYRYLS